MKALHTSVASIIVLLALCATAWASAGDVKIRGSVTDKDGTAIAAAVIELRPWLSAFEEGAGLVADGDEVLATARSGDRGFFELSAPAGGNFLVEVFAEGRVAMESRLAHLFDDVELRPLELTPVEELVVRVEDATGGPLVGAQVRLSSRSRSGPGWRPVAVEGRTRKDGTATLESRRAGLVVTAFAPGFVPAATRAPSSGTVTLELEPGKARAIEVRDAGGRAVAGALVRRFGRGAVWLLGVSDEDGRCVVYSPAKGDFKIAVETVDGRYATRAITAPEPGTTEPVLVSLEEPATVSGQVTDALDDKPLVGARVWLAADPHHYGDSGRDGVYRFSVATVHRRSVRLRAAAPGYLRESVHGPAGDLQALIRRDIALQPAMLLRGRVIDGQGRGISAAAISSSSRLRAERGFTHSQANGRFRLRAAHNELYQLTVSKSGFLTEQTEAAAATDGSEAVEVVLRQGPPGFGSVVDVDGLAVREAEVRLSRQARLDQSLPFRSPSFVAETITGEDGRFELHNLASGTFDLRVKSPGFAETVVQGIEIAVGAGAVDFGTAVLEPGVDLHGRTVDPEGRPLAEVGVFWIPWQPGQWYRGFSGSGKPAATSDAAGSFVIEDLARGDKLTLEAKRDGFTQAQIAGVEVPAAEPVVLVLEARAKIRGVVVDTRGEPVAKALVSVVHEDADGGSGGSGRGCDSEGRFELEADASGRLKITASAPGFRSTDLGLEIAPGEVVDDLRLVLSLGAVVDGRILGPGGDPIAGADVSFFQLHFGYRSRERIVSDAEGRFRLEGLDVGPLVLRVWAEGFPRQSRQLEVQSGANPLEIRFETTHQIHGRVVDEAWSPVGGASVHASNQDYRSGARTGADGTFTVEGLPDGSYRLSAGKEGFARTELDREVEVAGGPVAGVEIRLSAGGAVAGRILGLDPGLLAGVAVILEPGRHTTASRPGGGVSTTAIDALGGYRFENLKAGDWTVVAIEPASGRTTRGHTALGPGDDEVVLDVEFVEGLTLSGRVLVDGEPAPMVRIEVEGLDVLSAGETRTDYRGGFRLVDLRPGRYRLEARRQELVEHREIELPTDREIEIELSTYNVGGTVLDAEDAGALVGAEVMLLPLTGGGERPSVTRAPRLRTDSRGLFRFVGVAEGSYRLRVEHRGYGPLEEPIAVGAGADPGALELRLARVEGLTLKIRRTAGGVPRWVSVLALDGSGVPVLATSVAVAVDGTAPLSSLPAGSWLLVIAAPDAGVARQAVDSPGDPVAVVLPPATRIDVRVLELAGTGGLATLTVTDSGGRPFVSVSSSYPVHLVSEWPVRDGRATVEGLPPGRWRLSLTTPDGRSWNVSASAPASGGNLQLDLD